MSRLSTLIPTFKELLFNMFLINFYVESRAIIMLEILLLLISTKFILFSAVRYGHKRIVQQLLLKGADMNKMDDYGITPIFDGLIVLPKLY